MIKIICFQQVEHQKKRYILLSGISGVAAYLTPIIINLLADTQYNSDIDYFYLIFVTIPVCVFIHWCFIISSKVNYNIEIAEEKIKDESLKSHYRSVLNLISLLMVFAVVVHNSSFFYISIFFSALFGISMFLNLRIPSFYLALITIFLAIIDVRQNNDFYGVYILLLIIPILNIINHYLKYKFNN